jgi:hypothetical protein
VLFEVFGQMSALLMIEPSLTFSTVLMGLVTFQAKICNFRHGFWATDEQIPAPQKRQSRTHLIADPANLIVLT